MVHLLRSIAPVVAALLGASSCTPSPSPQPPPTQPVMVSGRVTGTLACGPQTVSQGPLGTFTCAMPTTAATAFLLTPAIRNTPNGPQPNEVAILTVTTQSGKNLDIQLRSSPGNLIPQRQFPDVQGLVPQVLGRFGEVAVSTTDDGTTKTWALTVRLSRCREVEILNISAVTPGGPPSSTNLGVVLFRPMSEVQTGCPPQMSRAKLVSITPDHGAPGRMVTLTGSGFSSNTVQVKFGNSAPVQGALDATRTTTTVAVPRAAFGPVSVSTIDPVFGQTTVVNFTITGATPVISGISSLQVPIGGLMTLTGQRFSYGMKIQLVASDGTTPPLIDPEDMSVHTAVNSATFRVPQVSIGTARVKIGYADEILSNEVSFRVTP